ncbi:MAG: hypothetical protein HYR97_00995 [Candidatus Melainabacteria bacterium]|nr:hypothetical protein [Candidatus Melainabacteria bacterium]
MVDVNPANALKVLQNIVTKSTGGKDDEITRGEVRRALDTNKDGFVSTKELNDANMDLLRLATDPSILNSEKDPNKRAQLQKAQELLLDLLRDNTRLREAPPDPAKAKKIENDPLIKNPYDLKDKDARARWSKERNKYIEKRIELDLVKEKNNINKQLGKDKNAANLVKALWTNDDSIDGSKTNVIRMNELIGAWAATKNDPALRKQFVQEMAKYINDKNNGLDPQFVLDSLLQVIQSTDFTGQKDLQNFLKEIALETAKGGDFAKRGDGVIANYDSTNEGGVFGSLALVKNGNKFEFIEHDPANQFQKTRYLLNNQEEALKPDKPGRAGGFGPGVAPPADATPDPNAGVAPGVNDTPVPPELPIPPPGSPLAKAVKDLGLIQNPDGSFSRPGYTGQYLAQPDGSIFYTGGTGPKGKLSPQTYANGDWDQTRNHPSTTAGAITYLGLKENNDGTFSRPEYEGKYIIQADGSIFYTGGEGPSSTGAGRANKPPQTLINGKWDQTKTTPIAGNNPNPIDHLGLVQNPNGTFSRPGHKGEYRLQADGSIFYPGGTGPEGPDGTDRSPQTFANGKWDSTRNTPMTDEQTEGIFNQVKQGLEDTHEEMAPGVFNLRRQLPPMLGLGTAGLNDVQGLIGTLKGLLNLNGLDPALKSQIEALLKFLESKEKELSSQ